MSKFEEQAKAFGVQFVYDEVRSIEERESVCFTVKTANNAYDTCAVILAFGKTPRDLGAPGEEKFKGKGVSYCAVCDGPLFKGKTVAVTGSGDPALDAAALLGGVVGRAYLVHTWEKPLGDNETLATLKANAKIEFVPFSRVVEVQGDRNVTGVVIEDSRNKQRREIPVDGLFVEMGYVAKTDFVKDLVQLNDKKDITIDKECATTHSGIFAAGDITTYPSNRR